LGGRGRRHSHEERDLILGLVIEAMDAGARQDKVCETLGVDVRTVQRWMKQEVGEDGRAGPKKPPANKLNEAERRAIMAMVNNSEYRDLSPKQIVPRLADQGMYLGSEATIYRIFRQEGQLQHRAPSKPATSNRPRELVATGPNQVWSWDITYLKSPISGAFYYLYMIVDVFSRKIVGQAVHDSECQYFAAALVEAACLAEGVDPDNLTIHSDNGGPMKGATMAATLERLGIMPSFSRPRVSDDNPYSESLFRTVKYRPEYPSGPFASLDAARTWVDWFVEWYNHEHLHSAIGFVTPAQRHTGEDRAILERRHEIYQQARARHPERWSGNTRDWSRVEVVRLNPSPSLAASEVA